MGKYEQVFKKIPDVYFETGLDGKIKEISPSIEKIIGYKREDLIGSSAAKLYEAPEKMREFLKKILEKESIDDYEMKIIHSNGVPIHYSINATLLRDKRDRPYKVAGIIRDITKHKQLEEMLREKEERYHNLFENAGDAIFIADAETGIILDANKNAGLLMGYKKEEIIGINQSKLHPGEIRDYKEQFKEHLSKEYISDSESEIVMKDGTIVPVSISASVTNFNGKKVVQGIFRNISERKQIENLREMHLERLHKILKATIEAVTMVVEIRDPYTAGHQKRVSNLARSIAQEMNLSSQMVEGIRIASLMHDIGKISIPAEILSKPTKLSPIEFDLIKTHSQSGYEILKDIDFSWPIAEIILQHHERMDGSGYPRKLSNGNILLEARVLAVADVVEAMSSHRPYRPAKGVNSALDEITLYKNICYDSNVVDSCIKLFKEKGYEFQ